MGFFKSSSLQVSERESAIPLCGVCGLHTGCQTPKMGVAGQGGKGVLVVVDHPTHNDDSRGSWLAGRAGSELRDFLKTRCSLDADSDCWITGSSICSSAGQKTSPVAAAKYCRANLRKTLQELDPISVLCFGDTALRSVVTVHHGAEAQVSDCYRGWNIPSQTGNRWILGTFAPTLISTEERNPVYRTLATKHVSQLSLTRPWKSIPKNQVVFPSGEREIQNSLKGLKDSEVLAFDYETQGKKPDHDGAELLCVAVSNGKLTVAFMLNSEMALRQWSKFLQRSEDRGVWWTACNKKFEHRWTYTHLGIEIQRWGWCSLNGAHILQNRPEEFTSLKLQSFLLFGHPEYGKTMKKVFKTSSDTGGTMTQVSSSGLLKYCATDAFNEWHVGRIQRDLLKYTIG